MKYKVGYWGHDETYADDAVDYAMPVLELAADLVLGNLSM